jgi:hypothetical protein
MTRVFLLWHIHRLAPDTHGSRDLAIPSSQVDDGDDVKLLGVYSSREAVDARIERARQSPGFRDHPDSFHVDAYVVDKDEWSSGFSTYHYPLAEPGE